MDPSSHSSSGLSGFPALLPPRGVTSGSTHPNSIGPQITVASIICLTLMTLSVIVRFYTKLFIKHVWGWSDYFCIPAMIGAVGFAATSISMVHGGLGLHQSNVPISAFAPDLFRKIFVVDVIYAPTILMAKLSLLLLYLEVFRPNVKLTYFIYLGIVLNVLFYASATIVSFVSYMPKPGQSNLEIRSSSNALRNNFVLFLVGGCFNVGSDFYILCLPISGIWKLQLAPNQKIGILGIFLTGLLACLSSVVSLYYRTKLRRYSDVTYDLVPVLLWAVVELCVGVICSSLLSFAGFFRYHLPLLRSIMSPFGSFGSKVRPSLLKPFSQSGDHSPSKKLFTKDKKVILGSRIDGKGRFLSTGSLFAKEDWQNKTDSSTWPDHATKGEETHREYFERWNRDVDIENQPLRPPRIKTHSTQP